MKAWTDGEDLGAQPTWLLEASAGTGKTFQIASLVTRLVVEHGVPIDRVLAITFTNAATSELRDRVRARLRDTLAAFVEAPKDPDPVLAALVARTVGDDARATARRRLELALRSFDLAPISTIHGFSQRMLTELAFDSGQDPDLELVEGADEVIDEIVDDTLAALYVGADPETLGVLEAAGVTRDALVEVARKMSGATEPRVLPDAEAPLPAGADVLAGAREEAAAFVRTTRAMRARWRSAEARSALDALVADAKGKLWKGARADYTQSSIAFEGEWLEHGAPPVATKSTAAHERLRTAKLQGAWTGSAPLASRPYAPLLAELDAFVAEAKLFRERFVPLAAFARTVRARVERALERRRALTFDAILSRLAERIEQGGGASSALAGRIRARFDAVFVDEFQDTDAAQWAVIRAAFLAKRVEGGRERPWLFLIGDPKQAIYAFRGADVHVYLEAARAVPEGARRTMGTNYRSDPLAVQANNALFRAGSRAFDEDAIDYVEVGWDRPRRLEAEGFEAGLDVRWVDARVRGGSPGQAIGAKDLALAAKLAAREVCAWLGGERGRFAQKGGAARRPGPGDLAVLVDDRYQAAAVVRALARAGVPAVAAARDSVFDTDAAAWLAAWLDAVAGAGRDRAARTAVVTPLFGWTADDLAWSLAAAGVEGDALPDRGPGARPIPDWTAWTERLSVASERFRRVGFARTFDAEAAALGVLPRLLATPEGERHATDLRHVFELAHVEERTRRAGPAALAAWLRAEAGALGDAAAQRLESDALAVKVETVHVSKGLEYPIVLTPFAWSARGSSDKGRPLPVRGPSGAELHVGVVGTDGREDARARADAESRRELLRRQYVALTRARHRTVAWYGPIGSEGAAASATAFGRLLLRDPDRDGFDDAAMPTFDKKGPTAAWGVATTRLDALVARSKGAVVWSAEAPIDAPARFVPEAEAAPPAIAIARFPDDAPPLGEGWAVASFTSLAAGSAAPDRDERLSPDDAIARARARGGDGAPVGLVRPARVIVPGVPPARLERGGGAAYGTCVHEVLEALDFATATGKDGRPLDALVKATTARLGLAGEPGLASELVARLPDVLATPLDGARAGDAIGALPAGFALRDVALADRLDELAFDLRLGAGTAFRRGDARGKGALDRCDGSVDPRAVYDAILGSEDARRPAFAAWAAHLDARRREGLPLVESVAGILTGSIDLVLRVRGAADRFFVVDYKTNRIDDSSPGAYTSPWLAWEMARAGYPLQALLYTLALHRHLGARMGAAYDYDRHVGGFLYLFLRGMAGPDTPRDPDTGRALGVFAERFSRATVEGLDAALSANEEVSR